MENPSRPLLGIVIPTLNEGDHLPHLLSDLEELEVPHVPIVADGGSVDTTRRAGAESGVRFLEAPPGRARQMNAGAAASEAEWHLFLHADSRLPPTSIRTMEDWLREAGPGDVGTFRFRLEGDGFFLRATEFGQRIRERALGLAYGDQGLLVHRSLFREVGGFPDIPLMEDVEIHRRLRRMGRWRRIPAPLLTSPRRFGEDGRLLGWIRNLTLISLYLLGVSPNRLAFLYPPRTPPRTGALALFAKAPRPGQVKTRLAAEVGDEEAARIYVALAGEVVRRVAGGEYQTVVFYDPPDARGEMEAWMGEQGHIFRPQAEGDLGIRLREAVREVLGTWEKVVVVGTDIPHVTRGIVDEAFTRLDGVDLVLGPAEDGGYYLIGMKARHPDLFREVPWSSPRVMEVTLERARELGLEVGILPCLRDVDTLADWLEVEPTLSS